jgi:deferrochelatase/peroxidase EfeB
MSDDRRSPISRRRFLGAAGAAGALGAAATLGTDALAAPTRALATIGGGAQVVPFRGQHQAGISTVVQDRLMFASFDVQTEDRAELVDLLREWTRASERMSVGRPVGRDNEDLAAPPDDTGEAVGLTPANLTVTFGFGASLLARDGRARFGLDGARPDALVDLPVFNSDVLDPARSDGDLAVQACADDPQVAFHAIRNLTRIGRGIVTLRWSQLGFGRTSTTSPVGQTPRNLMGFKDGTNNVKSDEAASLDRHVWVGAGDQPGWMRGGSYLVVRRIRMLLEVWDRSTLSDQELTIGRVKGSGAPLGEAREHQPLDLAARHAGERVIPADAHVRLAAPETNDGAAMLRRGYSFTDGIDPVRNQLDAGLFFIAYQRDPRTGFIPVQERLARNDALNEYIRHETSGLFAVPPGTRPGGYVGETLLA